MRAHPDKQQTILRTTASVVCLSSKNIVFDHKPLMCETLHLDIRKLENWRDILPNCQLKTCIAGQRKRFYSFPSLALDLPTKNIQLLHSR